MHAFLLPSLFLWPELLSGNCPSTLPVAASKTVAPVPSIVGWIFAARTMDDLDQALRDASPFVADVYLDLTTHRADTLPRTA